MCGNGERVDKSLEDRMAEYKVEEEGRSKKIPDIPRPEPDPYPSIRPSSPIPQRTPIRIYPQRFRLRRSHGSYPRRLPLLLRLVDNMSRRRIQH